MIHSMKANKAKKKKRQRTSVSPEVEPEVIAEKPDKPVHTLPAGVNACNKFLAAEIQKEVVANECVEDYLHSDGVSEVDALYSLQLAKRLNDPSEEASLWTDTDPSLIGVLRWSLDWCLEEYDPRSTGTEVRLRFLEFTEQVILYREACRVEDFLSYAIGENEEAGLVSAIMASAKEMIIPDQVVSITTEDVREAVGLYLFMKEGRDILMAPMGRALIRAAQLGGDRWTPLSSISDFLTLAS